MSKCQKSRGYLFAGAALPAACAALVIASAGAVSAQAMGGWFHPPTTGNTPSRATAPSASQTQTFSPPVGRQFPNSVRILPTQQPVPIPNGAGYNGAGAYGEARQIAPVQTYSNAEPTIIHSSGGAYGIVARGRVIEPDEAPRSVTPQGSYTISRRMTQPQGPQQNNFRIITPVGPTSVPSNYYQRGYFYNPNPTVVIVNGPALLGGYYYSNYCERPYETCTYRSVYSDYDSFPRYIYNPTVIVVSQPYCPYYVTSYLPFSPPVYQVTYNQNNYYVASQDRVRELNEGGDQAQEAIQNAYPADSYQAAFADIERAWADGSMTPLKAHLRDTETKISVFLDNKYSYSITSGDYAQITRDALDHLNTLSFAFTAIRKAKNGDVTAYGKHVYRGSSASETAPQDTQSNDEFGGDVKTVYVSYTLRHRSDLWYLIAIDSSKNDLVPPGD